MKTFIFGALFICSLSIINPSPAKAELCTKPATQYLKMAEKAYEQGRYDQNRTNTSGRVYNSGPFTMNLQEADIALKLYQICSQLEKENQWLEKK